MWIGGFGSKRKTSKRGVSSLVDERLSSIFVVEDWDRDAPGSLSGDAPVGPSVQHGQQAAPR